MSYDLMVFDPGAAPQDRKAFLAWYAGQTEWSEPHGYDDPAVLTPQLRAWFQELIESFPPMNGPLASDDPDDPRVTEYSLGRSVVYAAFAWSEASAAYDRAIALAAKHQVGFFDVSASQGDIWLPAPDGRLAKLTK